MSDLLFDTCFLIDLERDLRRGAGSTQAFLAQHSASCPWICWTVAGEFAEGFGNIDDPACATMLGLFEVLDMARATVGHYARITGMLRKKNLLIGANDLWIAAAALASGFPLVTNNTFHFSRVPGLKVVGY